MEVVHSSIHETVLPPSLSLFGGSVHVDHSATPPVPARASFLDKFERSKERPRLPSIHLEISPSDVGQIDVGQLLIATSNSLGPPLPPREPLRRSVSLTHRPPPPPTRAGNDGIETPAPSNFERVISPSRVVSHPLTRSAPTLNLHQVIPVSRWPLRERPTHVAPNRAVQVIPLARWPLPESSGRLAMDCITTKSVVGNEYVDSPKMAERSRHTTPKNSTHFHVISVEPGVIVESNDAQGSTTLNRSNNVDDASRGSSDKDGIMKRLRQFVKCRRHSSSASSAGTTNCKGRTICRRCGKCRCTECTKSSTILNCCGSDGISTEALVDTCSCMCCVRPIFYHCLKDDNGEEDCSDDPCACCSRPHCALRWTIMALLVSCLPCLCLYLPLRCAFASCRECCGGPGCQCRSQNPTPGLKRLLDSESSST